MNKWHFINFKIKWDKKPPAKFFIDLIIIDLLFVPVIKKFKPDIILWRLHRSATNDGHILRFIFYTNPEKAKEILNQITSDKFYNFIESNYLETKIYLEGGSEKIESTSDDKWPLEIQKAWPYYIMGASEMFINLIEEIKKSQPDEIGKNNLGQLEGFYKEINEKITKKWQNSGQHAFFHHLEAIFGYEATLLLCKLGDQDMVLPFKASRNIFQKDN